MNVIDRVVSFFDPKRGLERQRARAAAELLSRYFDAASSTFRTNNWPRRHADANTANAAALPTLRAHARDLQRNNAWAQNGLRAIGRNTVGWGIMANVPEGAAADAWNAWAGSTQCDSDGRQTLYGIQHQIIEGVARDGEILVRRRPRMEKDGLAIPLQLQVLEADFLDHTKDGIQTPNGGQIIQGVEFDPLGRRSAYWLYEQHPGSVTRAFGARLESRRVPAENIVHVFRQDRPGQVRGISWLSAAIVALKDFDEFEDATIVRQKVAALFAVFVEDPDGSGSPLGSISAAATASDAAVDELTPGMIHTLSPGKKISFASPPAVVDAEFTKRALQRIAAAVGVTYEDLTGDYSEVNFSSARMARLAHWANVHDWRHNMLIPQFCDPVWKWAMEMALISGRVGEAQGTSWTPPPMPMIEPDKEGLALQRLVRAGVLTPDEMVREQGYDPNTHWPAYAASFKRLDDLGIVIDGDARKVTQAGLAQAAAKGDAATSAADERALDEALTEAARALAEARAK